MSTYDITIGEIADEVEMHRSSISRIINNKFVPSAIYMDIIINTTNQLVKQKTEQRKLEWKNKQLKI